MVLSNAMRFNMARNLERTRLPYIVSISEADRLVVMCVITFLEMNRSYLERIISAITLHSFP